MTDLQASKGARHPDDYSMVVGGLVQCRRCAALLLDTRPARDLHDSFHAALRKLWDQAGGRPGGRP
jgi:hypothetical protein